MAVDLSKENAYSILLKILSERGINDDADIQEYLSLKPQLTFDPFLLTDMDAGVDFLTSAIKDKKKICIYGDYDVDGITATALLHIFLTSEGADVSYYLPSRIDEGYGLNKTALKTIKDDGFDVVVTVDCGSVSITEVEYAKSIGLEIMITDHHDLQPNNLPDCIVLNPKRTDGEYPFEGLSGCGVAFKLACAMKNGKDRAVLHDLIDLVALATIADVMPLTSENRTMVKYGIKLINARKRKAIEILLDVAGVKKEKIDTRDIAFAIAPRLNAAGRLGSAEIAVELFITTDVERMQEIANQLDTLNHERRSLQDECFESCVRIIEGDKDDAGNPLHKFHLLQPPSVHEGVSGIVAGKIKEFTGLPTAVLAETDIDEGKIAYKGSARSVGNLDISKLFQRHSDLLLRFGGHAMAAGFLVAEENVDKLREELCDDIDLTLEENPNLLTDIDFVDAEISIKESDVFLAEELVRMEPFGRGNAKPALKICAEISDISSCSYLGAEKLHVRFYIGSLQFIMFSGAKEFDNIMNGFRDDNAKIEIIGCPEMNEWQGRRNIQYIVSSLALANHSNNQV